MANVTITDLPAAQPLDGTELVPIVQGGITVRTTTSAVAGSPDQQQTFITLNQEPTLPNSRALAAQTGIGLTDGGAQAALTISLNGASGSLEAASTGIVVKTGGSTVTARSIAVSGAGLTVSDASGVSGNPTLALSGLAQSLANLGGTGIVALTGAGTATAVVISGTVNEIDVANGAGVGGPTIGLADNPVIPGTADVTIPKGTTAERDGTPADGAIRFNTETQLFEGYNGVAWSAFSTSTAVTTFSGGSTGLTPSVATYGPITLAGTLVAGNGGTGYASYTTGDILYASGATALSKLGIGTSTHILTSSGSAPQWTDPATISVNTAANVSGGAAGSIVYNSASGVTTFLALGTSGYVLTAGASAPEYVAQSTLSVGSSTNVSGGAANQIVYNTGSGATSFIAAPTISNTYLEWSGSAFQWSSNPLGTVTSVGLSLPSEFTVTNSPVTTSGTLTGAWALQSANYIFAGPTTGAAATPAFRALVDADIPSALTGKTYNGITLTALATGWKASGGTTAVEVSFIGGAAYSVSGTNGTTITLPATTGTVALNNQTFYLGTTQIAINRGSGTITLNDVSIDGLAGSATNIAGGSAGAIAYNTAAGATTFLSLGTTNYVLTAGASAPQYVAQSTLSVGSATAATNIAGGAAGSVPYNSGSGTTTFLALGTTNYVLTAGASAPQYVAQSTLSVGSATTATTATNVAGGAAGSLVYQTGAGATSTLALGTTNYVLTAGASAPQYVAQSTLSVGSATSATNTTNIAVTDDTTTNATMYPVWVTANTGNLPAKVTSTKLSFNPSSGALTATGGISGGTF